MILEKDQFPITIQAYEVSGDRELFIAEQVVNSQSEVDAFSARYAGKLIKAKPADITRTSTTTDRRYRRGSSAGTIILVIIIILIILVAIGFYTGWIQKTTGISL